MAVAFCDFKSMIIYRLVNLLIVPESIELAAICTAFQKSSFNKNCLLSV